MLKIKNLNAFYGDVQVLYDINLEIKEKEIVTILGSNGAGKTTLMKTICGIETRRTGEIEFENESLMKVPAYKLVTKESRLPRKADICSRNLRSKKT